MWNSFVTAEIFTCETAVTTLAVKTSNLSKNNVRCSALGQFLGVFNVFNQAIVEGKPVLFIFRVEEL